MNYSNSAVVFLGRITSNTNKMSDSRDETLCHQNIALVKIKTSKLFHFSFSVEHYFPFERCDVKAKVTFALQYVMLCFKGIDKGGIE